MRLIILGAPGSGKGTQAKLLARDLKLKNISMGAILREEIARKTKLGKFIQTYVQKGDLVPLKYVNHIIEKVLPKDNFLLDGYPRRTGSARFLNGVTKIDYAVLLNVPFSVLKKRLLKRAKIEGRSDDNPTTIKERFKVYHDESEPVIKYYKTRLISVDGVGKPEEINKKILALIRSREKAKAGNAKK